MGKQRPVAREQKSSPWWFHPSQVFADTQKVDLFNDPKWETSSPASPRQVMDDGSGGLIRWAVAAFRRVLQKRGAHSRNLV